MKQILLLLLVCALTLGAQAQETSTVTKTVTQTDEKTSKKEVRKAKKAAIYKDLSQTTSQFRVGWGLGYGSTGVGCAHQPQPGFREENLRSVNNWSAEYSYRVWNYLEVGVGFAYSKYRDRKEYLQSTNALMLSDFGHSFSVGINARYSWFNSRWVSLYSSVGIWYVHSQDKYNKYTTPTIATNEYYNKIWPEITPIGVRVGRKLFGYFEPIGFSPRGFGVMCGIGYKF